MKEGRNIQIIEWQDLDKKKFLGIGIIFSGILRFTIYPTNLVKTRLQAQEGKTAYKGLFDAFKQIGRAEGLRGFYKGFPISLVQLLAGQMYITTYELSKQTIFSNQHISVQHLLGGFLASTVSQTIMVPIDIVAQHQQVMGASHKMSSVDLKSTIAKEKPSLNNKSIATKKNPIGQALRISSEIFKSQGLSGLYRGYLVSLCTYGSNSAFYWAFYYLYSELIEEIMPESNHRLREPSRIVSAGFLGSATAVVLTNPLDVVRTRYQLQAKHKGENASAWNTYKWLMETEGLRGFKRGLTARITSSSFNSCAIVLVYEYLKKMSVKPGSQNRVHKKSNEFETSVIVSAN